jgi:RNA polymerase sigma-70 factor
MRRARDVRQKLKSKVIIRSAMFPQENLAANLLDDCADSVEKLYAQCVAHAPNFGVMRETFQNTLERATCKYLLTKDAPAPSKEEIEQFLNDLQINDLFLALGCAAGNERAWWEFDQQHRSYLERVARHLASSDVNAEEVVDTVYVELYGTRIVDGARISKFATYTGRGNLRGWLRTIVWHALVDLHRASHDEVSLDEMTETVGEGAAQAAILQPARGGEGEMLDSIVRERYRTATVAALEKSFAELDDHEKLLLLYYHVEELKLREIARLVEAPASPLRSWFQRKSEKREQAPDARVHESTVMRWLEKTYAKILRRFREELKTKAGFKDSEINLCMEVATQDLARGDIKQHLKLA